MIPALQFARNLFRLLPLLVSIPTMPSASAAQSCLSGACGTPVGPGLVTGHWMAAGSPYCITGNIQVSALTIDAGVCVLVDGNFRIDVLSAMTAIGTQASPIVFTAKQQSPWGASALLVFT